MPTLPAAGFTTQVVDHCRLGQEFYVSSFVAVSSPFGAVFNSPTSACAHGHEVSFWAYSTKALSVEMRRMSSMSTAREFSNSSVHTR